MMNHESVHALHDILGSELGSLILLTNSTPLSLAIQQGLPVLVKPELSDHHLGRVNSHVNSGTINLFPCNPLDMNNPFSPVNLDNLPFPSLVCPTNNLDLIVFSDRHGSHAVFLTEVSGKWCAHEDTTHGGWRREVGLTALSAGGGDSWVVLHCGIMESAARVCV
ncbi:hypothetical protein OIU74_005072 [Salix koriyanagi]|uniref:Uncharacterized protein n=1 Tax=Salix koriyanagi TaxID=2511006 RepID=A0A9Q0UN82_9ROSI|nr:hypothetical protein OIU74_005072 [Salix koriyanagi]